MRTTGILQPVVRKITNKQKKGVLCTLSGRRESNSVILLPKQAYYRYTTARQKAQCVSGGSTTKILAKYTMKDDSFKDFVLDQLVDIPDVTERKMFGAFGLYSGGYFFAIIDEGVLYLKTDSETKQKFLDAGMDCFRPSKEQVLKNYFEVPADVLEDREVLSEWALEAIHTASGSTKR